jgi:TRAP-type C4-dicarboxylate transport system permease small subunit
MGFVERFIERFAGVLLASVSLLTVVEVVLRRFTTLRIPDAYTIGGLVQGMAIIWGIAVAVLAGQHIAVDILWEAVGARWRRRMDLFATACCAVFFVALAWMSYQKVVRSYESNESLLELGWPLWPMYAIACAGTVFALLAALVRLRILFLGKGDPK